jgi:hypothetical protein
MKKRVLVCTGLLLTLGTAASGALVTSGATRGYGDEQRLEATQDEITPELIASWKATAASTDYVAPKAPI